MNGNFVIWIINSLYKHASDGIEIIIDVSLSVDGEGSEGEVVKLF